MALANTHVYQAFGQTILLSALSELWATIVMAHVFFFALLLAAFEMSTGIFTCDGPPQRA